MKFVLKLVATVLLVGALYHLVDVALFLVNQPNTMVFFVGLALFPVIAGTFMWGLKHLWGGQKV